MIKCCIVVLLISLFCFAIGAKLPSTFKTCKVNDPDIENCFAKAVQHALPYLNEPIPELNLPSMNPVLIEKIEIEPGPSSSITVTQKFQNVKIYNVLDIKVNKSEITRSTKDFKLVLYIYVKLLKVEYDYEMEGKLILVPIAGKGDAYLEFGDVQGTITLSGEFQEKKGRTYLKLNDLLMDINPSTLKIQYNNLFNGDERLGNEMNKLMNENGKQLLGDLKPSISEAFSVYMKSVFGAVFKIPYDELFPV